jgi:hypothetical protein
VPPGRREYKGPKAGNEYLLLGEHIPELVILYERLTNVRTYVRRKDLSCFVLENPTPRAPIRHIDVFDMSDNTELPSISE